MLLKKVGRGKGRRLTQSGKNTLLPINSGFRAPINNLFYENHINPQFWFYIKQFICNMAKCNNAFGAGKLQFSGPLRLAFIAGKLRISCTAPAVTEAEFETIPVFPFACRRGRS
ncbi:MAG: hypothetical protein ABI476_08010 [Oxalobacteraceae bacterium]